MHLFRNETEKDSSTYADPTDQNISRLYAISHVRIVTINPKPRSPSHAENK